MIMIAAAVALTVRTANAQAAHFWDDPHGWWGGHFVYDPHAEEKFMPNEFSVDLFGSYLAGQRKLSHVFQNNIRDDGRWGGGVGLNYFLTREIGIGGDFNIPDNGGNFIDSANGHLIARLPFETTGLAPYIYGGGGRQTDPSWDWTGHAGVGIEFRLNPLTGIFADARYTWADDLSDSSLFRAGLRIVF